MYIELGKTVYALRSEGRGTFKTVGFQIKDYPEIIEKLDKLEMSIASRCPVSLGQVTEGRYFSDNYKVLGSLAIYQIGDGQIVLNFNSGEQFFIPKRVRTSSETIPYYIKTWNKETTNKLLELVNPPTTFDKGLMKTFDLIEIKNNWDMKIYKGFKGEDHYIFLESKSEHTVHAYKVREEFTDIILSKEDKNELVKIHTSIEIHSLDKASIIDLVFL